MTEYTIQELMQKAIDAFQPEQAAGVDLLIQLHLTGEGEDGGDWAVTIRDQKLLLEKEIKPDPDLMFSANTQDVLNIANGKLSPMQAFLTGKVRFKGEISHAMRLLQVFRHPTSWESGLF